MEMTQYRTMAVPGRDKITNLLHHAATIVPYPFEKHRDLMYYSVLKGVHTRLRGLWGSPR